MLFAFWLPVCGVLTFVSTWVLQVRDALALGGALFALQALLALWWPVLAFSRTGWRLDPDVLLVRRGVWFRSVVAIPRSRIQHVDVRRNPLELLVGLARIHVHTASGLGADGSVPGLTPEDAERLRQELVRTVRGEDGV